MEKNIVVIAEHSDDHVKSTTYEIIAFAKKLQQTTALTIEVIIIGIKTKDLALEIAKKTGLDVTVAQIPNENSYNGELYCGILIELFADNLPKYVCVAHSAQGLDYAPALAAKLNAACISGIEDVVSDREQLCFVRPLYGGKLVARVCPLSKISILTIQPGAFIPNKKIDSAPGVVGFKSMQFRSRRSFVLGKKHPDSDAADIMEANVVVAAGQGIGAKDHLNLIRQLASLFAKSAVAGSRIVCDLGWLEYRNQVGVTGATVSPQLYIACGISGAVQHVVGMRASEFIVAINKDPAAAIFQVADVCIVEDLKTFIPILVETYRKLKDKNLSS